MLKLVFTGKDTNDLFTSILDFAEVINGEKGVATATSAITQPVLVPDALSASQDNAASKPARKPRTPKAKTESGTTENNVKGATSTESAVAPAPAPQTLNPFGAVVAPTDEEEKSHISVADMKAGTKTRDDLMQAISDYMDAPNGGMEKALAILAKYGAAKMSDVKDSQIDQVIAEIRGAMNVAPAANIFA